MAAAGVPTTTIAATTVMSPAVLITDMRWSTIPLAAPHGARTLMHVHMHAPIRSIVARYLTGRNDPTAKVKHHHIGLG